MIDLENENSGKITICENCNEEKFCIYAPDPYASEINDDFTPIWECKDCRYESAMDI